MLLIFDGACGFCAWCAAWAARRLPDEVRVAPYQDLDLGEWAISTESAAAAAWWIDERGRQWRGHAAVGKALAACGGPWAGLGRALTAPPLSWAARPAYTVVARNRHRLRPRSDTCPTGARPTRASR